MWFINNPSLNCTFIPFNPNIALIDDYFTAYPYETHWDILSWNGRWSQLCWVIVLLTRVIPAGSIVLTTRWKAWTHPEIIQLERKTQMRQMSVTLTLSKVSGLQELVSTCMCVCVCVSLVKGAESLLIKVLRLFKVQRGAPVISDLAPQSTSFIFLLKMKLTCLCVSALLVNYPSRAVLRKRMTKWAYHLQQLLTGGQCPESMHTVLTLAFLTPPVWSSNTSGLII